MNRSLLRTNNLRTPALAGCSLSLTPRFSGVKAAEDESPTVSTVLAHDLKTVKTVPRRAHSTITPLKRGVNENSFCCGRNLVAKGWAVVMALLLTMWPQLARAFCGFYVAKADSKLFNRASQVVLAREGDKTVMTMANDYEGDPKEFAIVIPVPMFLQKDQIQISDRALIQHLDAYTAPRLVEYFDEDPCIPKRRYLLGLATPSAEAAAERAKALGVKIEAQYTVGEYEILILSAEHSDGLETWLKESGYNIPQGASKILASYIKQNLRFFVAKVNLAEQSRLGFTYLRPLRIEYESPKFMLPIRLGTVNADGPQDLFIYALSPKGRVETVNYRTVKLPTGMDVPLYVKDVFPDFYRAMFAEQVRKEHMSVVFLE